MKSFWFVLFVCLFVNIKGSHAQIARSLYFSESPAKAIAENGVSFIGDDASGKLIINIYNPRRKKFLITLYNDGARIYYRTSLVNYERCFNFSQAEPGLYMIIVSDGSHSVKKKLMIRSEPVMSSLSFKFY